MMICPCGSGCMCEVECICGRRCFCTSCEDVRRKDWCRVCRQPTSYRDLSCGSPTALNICECNKKPLTKRYDSPPKKPSIDVDVPGSLIPKNYPKKGIAIKIPFKTKLPVEEEIADIDATEPLLKKNVETIESSKSHFVNLQSQNLNPQTIIKTWKDSDSSASKYLLPNQPSTDAALYSSVQGKEGKLKAESLTEEIFNESVLIKNETLGTFTLLQNLNTSPIVRTWNDSSSSTSGYVLVDQPSPGSVSHCSKAQSQDQSPSAVKRKGESFVDEIFSMDPESFSPVSAKIEKSFGLPSSSRQSCHSKESTVFAKSEDSDTSIFEMTEEKWRNVPIVGEYLLDKPTAITSTVRNFSWSPGKVDSKYFNPSVSSDCTDHVLMQGGSLTSSVGSISMIPSSSPPERLHVPLTNTEFSPLRTTSDREKSSSSPLIRESLLSQTRVATKLSNVESSQVSNEQRSITEASSILREISISDRKNVLSTDHTAQISKERTTSGKSPEGH